MRVAAPSPAIHMSNPDVAHLYAEHHGWLRGWLARRVESGAAAADLTQDTFVNILEQPVMPVLRQPRAFLQVVASRLMINRFRRATLEAEIGARQLVGQVVALLTHELDERSRTAFLMARVEGHGYREIAAHLGVSETRVKQYLAKVLLHCHARLFPDGAAA
ncbi:MAG: RNA polymerase subunit sigma, partial [Variovorax paradoxus]